MHLYNITTYYGVKYVFHNTLRKIRFFGPVGFGPVVFWSSWRLVELVFGRVGFGRVVGGRVHGLPKFILLYV
jgi:hypothetical protein